MNKRFNLLKKAQNISVFVLLAVLAFGSYIPVAFAALSITTTPASAINYNSATLNGVLNEGSLTITAWFEYGTNPNLLNLTTNPRVYNNLGLSFSTPLSNLYTGATYYYRAVAENSQGRTYGNILSFTTAYYNPNYDNYVNNNGGVGIQPGVTTNGFTNLSGNSVVLSGFVNGNNLNTSAWFEYGTDSTRFTNSTTQTDYGAGVRNFNITLLDLKPNNVYYFRAVAQNAQGRTFGQIMSFTTGYPIYSNNPNNNVPTPNNTNLVASITPATQVYATSAKLNALIVNANSTPSTTWFEWSDNQNNLNNKTESINTGALPAVRHANTITGLKPNTTYYFRAVADNGSTRVVSALNYFITTNTSSGTTNNTQNTQNGGSIITPVSEEELSTLDLSANALGTGFLPDSLPEWLLLIIFILLIMLITQYLFFPEVVAVAHEGHGGGHH